MPESLDPQLVDKAIQGDQGALGQLLSDQQQRLYNVALRMVGNRDDAAEVTQEAMLKVIENINSFRGHSQITTWMIRITMNLSFSHLRKRRLRQTTSLDATGSTGPQDDQLTPLREQLSNPGELGPDLRVQQSEMVSHLITALDKQQDDLRAVLVLRDIDELDYDQIAEVLEIPVGTVKSRLFRGRLALRKEMLNIYPSSDPSMKLQGDRATSTTGHEPKDNKRA